MSAAVAVERAIGGMSTADRIASVSAIAALISAWFAYRGVKIGRDTLRRAESERTATEPPLDVYLADSFIQHIAAERRRIYVFRVLVTNKALVPNSIRRVVLRIRYGRSGTPLLNFEVPHVAHPANADATVPDGFEVPVLLAGRESVAGAAIFPVAEDLLQGANIESYSVAFIDTDDRESICEAILLKEMGR